MFVLDIPDFIFFQLNKISTPSELLNANDARFVGAGNTMALLTTFLGRG